jgi:quinohemoprotein ethanol dehydrogenase
MNNQVLGWIVGAVAAAVFLVPILALVTGGEPTTAPAPIAKPETPKPTLADDPKAFISAATKIDGARVQDADSEPQNWLAHGRTYSEQRFSPLDQISTENIGDLGVAWDYETYTSRGMEASPIVVDGIMFTTSSWSRVFALNAKTGEEIWTYDPEVPPEWARFACCDVVNRGVAVWNGRVYAGSLDGRLIALDAATGELVWETQTFDKTETYTITGAPRIVNGKVIIGSGGAEYGVRGYFAAFDAESGKELWRFHTVPGSPALPTEHPEMDQAMKTWSTGGTDLKWWEHGGGGTVWDSMAYDPDLNLLYVGTGNGSPWNRWLRSPGGGDNLFLSSILAVNPDTGRLVWHYQTTPGDTWDYTATQHMILAELEIDGATRKVIMQAPKNGFFYVLDRETGELLSAEPYARMNWATHVDMETGRPVEVAEMHYEKEMKEIYPNPGGGHNWHPMAYSPQTGLVYIPVHDGPFGFATPEDYDWTKGAWNTGSDFNELAKSVIESGADITAPTGKGMLKAWDPIAGKAKWVQPRVTSVNGGLLATAGGLLFQGTADGRVLVMNAETGDILKSFETKIGVIAPPVTYSVDGEQYVAVLVGFGGGGFTSQADPSNAVAQYTNDGHILAFKLGGTGGLPDPAPHRRDVPKPPMIEASAETLELGARKFNRYCAACHGFFAISPQQIPDLRFSQEAIHDIYPDIVLEGLLAQGGMARFDDVLNADDVDAIQAYVVGEAWAAYNKQHAPSEPAESAPTGEDPSNASAENSEASAPPAIEAPAP